MPRKKIYTTIEMDNRQMHNWRNRVKKGGAFELDGAYGDKVYVPRSINDADPAGSRNINRLRLQKMRRFIDEHKKNPRRQKYVVT